MADRYKSDDAVSLSPDSVETMVSLTQEGPENLLALRPSPKTAAEIDRALRWFVRARIDRDLKSADFLDQLRAGKP